jgi:phosphate transport system protein
MITGHTVSAFDSELAGLHSRITAMGDLAQRQMLEAMEALMSRDEVASGRIIARDMEIDQLEREVESRAVRVLALRQPMAKDLREVITALKISGNLERIGDFAANCAKRVIAINQVTPSAPLQSMRLMVEMTAAMVRDVVRAYVDEDLDLALEVRRRDQEIDAIYTSLFREMLTYMMETPQQITPCTHLVFIAKNIERIGDHATNIAESVCFLIKGHLPDEERLKDDLSSFAVVGKMERPAEQDS